MKTHMVFDATDSGTLLASDNVGAYVRASGGELIDANVVNTKNTLWASAALFDGSGNAISSTAGSLNVNMTNAIEVGVADKTAFTYGTSAEQPIGGVYQDTSPSLTAGETGAVRLTANRAFHINLRDASGAELVGQKAMAASVPVAIASDQAAFPIELQDGSGNAIASTAGAINAFLTNSTLAVTQSGTWSTRTEDGSGNAITSTGGALDVNIASSASTVTVSDAALANTAVAAAAASVGATEAALLGSQASGRKYLYLYNNGSKQIYLGPTGVTTSSGFPLFPGSMAELRLGPAVSIHAISAAGTQDVRTMQLS